MIAPAGNHLHVVLRTELYLTELIQSGFNHNFSKVVQLVIIQCKVIMKKLQGIATSFHREKCLQTAQLSLVIVTLVSLQNGSCNPVSGITIIWSVSQLFGQILQFSIAAKRALISSFVFCRSEIQTAEQSQIQSFVQEI